MRPLFTKKKTILLEEKTGADSGGAQAHATVGMSPSDPRIAQAQILSGCIRGNTFFTLLVGKAGIELQKGVVVNRIRKLGK